MIDMSEVREYGAEIKQLLRLMIDSLYTKKEIFLRELISNASDALDRLRLECLTQPNLLVGDGELQIRIDLNPQQRTLTISDNGIGMSRDEVIKNIGTLGKSGTKESRSKIVQTAAASEQLIGEFGVGFYSAFMVADKVKLVTRRVGETLATEWQSDGCGTYQIAEGEREGRGTSITLYLKEASPENGLEDYTDYWTVFRIVKQHSDFITYPIIAMKPKETTIGVSVEDDGPESPILNSMKPIWKRPESEISESEYTEFYRHISHDWTEPLKTLRFRAEGRFEYEALLYLPAKAAHDLYYVAPDVGIQLYSRRVMIMEKCSELLPRYLRFVKGVVDCEDFPLNISRQQLQQQHQMSLIRDRLTRKILDALTELFENQYEKYLSLWGEFGRAIKEGIAADFKNKDRILSIALFQSSHHPKDLTTLQGYVGRIKEGQNEIFYLTGTSRKRVEAFPHVEAIKATGYEILYLTDPVDELLLQHLPEFSGRKLKSVGKGTLTIPSGQRNGNSERKREDETEDFGPLLNFIESQLKAHAKQVRLSERLTDSPLCVVVDDHEYSPALERILKNPAGGVRPRTLELNPAHPLIVGLKRRYSADPGDRLLSGIGPVLYGLAFLLEGSDMPDGIEFDKLIVELLRQII